jgi:hypothetical protein
MWYILTERAQFVTNFIQGKLIKQSTRQSFPCHCHEGVYGEKRQSSTLISALDRPQWLASSPGRFNRGKNPIPINIGLSGPHFQPRHFEEDKNFCPYYNSNPASSRW